MLNVLVENRRTGEQLLCRMAEFSQKLCQYVTTDSVAHLEAEKARMSASFDSLSRDCDAAVNELTDRLMAPSKYRQCVDKVEMWLSKAERDVAELLSKAQLHQDPTIYLDQLRALLVELEGNWEKLDVLDQLGKCCGIAEAHKEYDGFSKRYEHLTNDLKVCWCPQYCRHTAYTCLCPYIVYFTQTQLSACAKHSVFYVPLAARFCSYSMAHLDLFTYLYGYSV